MYKKFVLAAALTVAAIAATAASAQAGPADVVRGNGCVGFDATGTPFFDPAADLQVVFTNNPNGVANARCRGTLPAGAVLPSRAMQFNFGNTGFICFGGDETWQQTVTPAGNFSFTCHLP